MRAGISMRELDPKSPHELPACAVVGAGRLGTVLAAALSDAPALRRGEPVPASAEVVLLCVPDGKIAEAAAAVPPGPLLGHCSGATGLDVFGDARGFLAAPADVRADRQRAGRAARRGRGDRRHDRAGAQRGRHARRARSGCTPPASSPEDRAAYHAAGAIAANFLVALEACAERLAATTGITRAQLAPLVLATAEQWARLGPEAALTGAIARGDEATVERHRAVIAERTPELLAVWTELAEVTRAVAGRRSWT